MMRRPALTALPLFSIAAAILPFAAAMLVLPTASAHAASYTTDDYAARLLTLVNDVRESHGLRSLEQAGGTTAVATGWTEHLAAFSRLAHNPDLAHQLTLNGSKRWQTYGENVGMGSVEDPDDLFIAYMKSPEHRRNILDGEYRYVGVAVTFAGTRAWNTFDFVDVYATATTPARHRITAHRSARPQSQPHTQAMNAGSNSSAAGLHPSARHITLRPTVRPATVHTGHRHSRPRARVEALHRSLPPALEALPHAPGSTAPTPVSHLPRASKGAAVVIALAVLALCVAARRWVLVAHGPATQAVT